VREHEDYDYRLLQSSLPQSTTLFGRQSVGGTEAARQLGLIEEQRSKLRYQGSFGERASPALSREARHALRPPAPWRALLREA